MEYKEKPYNGVGFLSAVDRLGAYIPEQKVEDGFIYAADVNYPSHFPVVRQGRFLLYGYHELFDEEKNRYAQGFFINLIARMDDF